MTSPSAVPPPPSSPPPGWYPDPDGGPKQRWWDGRAWTSHEQTVSPQAAYCRACGSQLDPRAVICPRCGVAAAGQMTSSDPTAAPSSPQPKSSAVAILLSFLFPGAGHLYIGGSNDKAIAFMVVSGVNVVLSLTLFWLVIGLPLWLGTAIYTMVDSNTLAKQWNLMHGFPAG
jgi:hypothetical protein